MGRKLSILAAMMLLSTWPAVADPAGEEVQACQAVRQEVEQYLATGSACPCPYNAAHDGHLCGGRSAWAKRKGASPLCFTGDSAQPVATGSKWPDPPACGAEILTRPIPSQISETRSAALPSSE